MTNCEKCGNPLQPGLTTCPICGTTAKSLDAPEVAMMQPEVESLGEVPVANAVPQSQPVAPAPVSAPTPIIAPAPVAPAPATATPAPAPTPIIEQPVAAPTPVVDTPVVAAPTIDPLPAQGFSGAEAAPIAPAPAPVVDTSVPTPAAPMEPAAPVAPAPIAPAPAVTDIKEDKKDKKKKNKGNIGLIIIVAIVALGLGLGGGYLLSPSLKAAPVAPKEEVATAQPVSLNGYSFSVEEGWQYSQIGNKVLVNKDDESVLARMAVYDGIFENMNTTSIELSLTTKEGYSDVEVEKTTLGSREAIIVNATNGESSVQYYYFAHNTEKVLSVTVVYAKKEDKKTYEETIKKLVEGTTYSDDAVNAIEAISPYGTLFDDGQSVYDSSFNDQKNNGEEQVSNEQTTPSTTETETPPAPQTVS